MYVHHTSEYTPPPSITSPLVKRRRLRIRPMKMIVGPSRSLRVRLGVGRDRGEPDGVGEGRPQRLPAGVAAVRPRTTVHPIMIFHSSIVNFPRSVHRQLKCPRFEKNSLFYNSPPAGCTLPCDMNRIIWFLVERDYCFPMDYPGGFLPRRSVRMQRYMKIEISL